MGLSSFKDSPNNHLEVFIFERKSSLDKKNVLNNGLISSQRALMSQKLFLMMKKGICKNTRLILIESQPKKIVVVVVIGVVVVMVSTNSRVLDSVLRWRLGKF